MLPINYSGETVDGCGRPHIVTAVWSSYSHTFIGADTDEDGTPRVECVHCGARYIERPTCELRPADLDEDTDGDTHYTRGDYVNGAGAEPSPCERGAGFISHGIERHCEGHIGPDHDPVWGRTDILPGCDDPQCPNVAHGCVCLLCEG